MKAPAYTPSRTSINGLVQAFQSIGVAATLTLSLALLDSWNGEEQAQGERLFREMICSAPSFREYVIYDLTRHNFDFTFSDMIPAGGGGGDAAWIDVRAVLRGIPDCQDHIWFAMEDFLLAEGGFNTAKTFMWMNMHLEESRPAIAKFQTVEFLYFWAITLLLLCVIICIIGSSIFAMAPASTLMLKTQIPGLLFSVLFLVIGTICAVQGHNLAIFGESSFRSKTAESVNVHISLFFMLPVLLLTIVAAGCTGFLAQLRHGVPIQFAWIPGIHGLFESTLTNEEREETNAMAEPSTATVKSPRQLAV